MYRYRQPSSQSRIPGGAASADGLLLLRLKLLLVAGSIPAAAGEEDEDDEDDDDHAMRATPHAPIRSATSTGRRRRGGSSIMCGAAVAGWVEGASADADVGPCTPRRPLAPVSID